MVGEDGSDGDQEGEHGGRMQEGIPGEMPAKGDVKDGEEREPDHSRAQRWGRG